MIKYEAKELASALKKSGQKVVLYGAGQIGEMCLYALNQRKINVDFFCDTSKFKEGKIVKGIKTISPDSLKKLDRKTNIFISNNYVSVVKDQLVKNNFEKIYDCVELFENTNFKKLEIKIPPLKVERRVHFYKNMALKDQYISSGTLNLKSVDIQITERCSLKCKDCSNLMQYYSKPENSEFDSTIKSIDRLLGCVNNIDEFRVIGGDPFMNKDIHKYINHLVKHEQVKKILVYTNGRIIPKGDNLNCLKNNKVILDISDYGLIKNQSKRIDELVKILDDNNILYSRDEITVWQDCGRILPFQKRTQEERERVFNNCCTSDLISLLHGKLYRCPFSANAHNLNAIPHDKRDIVDLLDQKITLDELKIKVKELTYDKKYLMACNFCNGRDYKTPAIDAAIQTARALPYEKKI